MPVKPKVTKFDKNNTKEFDAKIAHMNGIVLFHHPGCIHCIMMRPKWEMMKKKLNTGGDIMEVNVTALEESNSPMRDEVQAYPMIVHVENGKIKDKFKEERNIDNMLKFVAHHLNKSNKMNLDYNYKINKNDNLKKIKINKRKTQTKRRKQINNKKRKTQRQQ